MLPDFAFTSCWQILMFGYCSIFRSLHVGFRRKSNLKIRVDMLRISATNLWNTFLGIWFVGLWSCGCGLVFCWFASFVLWDFAKKR